LDSQGAAEEHQRSVFLDTGISV